MKKIVYCLLILLAAQGIQAQVLPDFIPYRSKIKQIGVAADSLFYLPVRDTMHTPGRIGALTIRPQDSLVYMGIRITTGGKRWDLWKPDTSGAFITSFYRVGDSVKYVKGGVHTFAFKDSTGGGIPTLQQVLTAGSTLTGNNTIAGGAYNFKFNKNNIWTVDSASQWLLRSFRAADSSMQLISSSASFASSIKRLTMQSQDSQYKSWNIIDYDHITNEVYTRPGADFLQSGNYLDENGFSIIKYDGSEANNSLNSFDLIGDSSRTAKRISYTSNINGTLTDYSLTTKKYVDSVALGGGSTYTFTNGLTESGGTVKLGGTLTANTSVSLSDNTLVFPSTYYASGAGGIFYNGSSGLIAFGDLGPDHNETLMYIDDANKKIRLYADDNISLVSADSLLINSNSIRLRTLSNFADTTDWKAVVINNTTGEVRRSTYWPGGGGSSASPGGSTKQIQYNNAGSFGGAAGFEYQSGSSPNVTITGQNAAHVPLYVKGIGSTQTADLFRVMRYDDSTYFRVSANGSVTIGPAYDYVNAIHPPGHEFRYSNSGYTGGIKIRNHNSGSEVRLHTVNNGLYLTDNGGSAAPMTLGTRTNPADASTFIAASGVWTISAGRFGVGGTADASAIIDGTSTTKGFLPPRMTGAQQNAISAPATGLMIYNTDSAAYTSYNGSAWRIVGKYLFGLNDALSSADRTFNLNNNKFDFDSGSVHIKAKVTSPRSDDIFSVGIGGTKNLYVTQTGQTYATELYAGSGSFYTLGGLIGINNTVFRLNGTTTFNSFQKKFEFIKEYPALTDSVGFEVKNDTSGISTLADTWANTYRIMSLKYRSGVDNSLIERFDFRGNGDLNITGTGATKFQSGNTSQRPSSPTTGMMRYNTDSTSFEYYTGSAWLKFGTASGGASDGYVDNATFNTTTNYLTIEQTGAADVSVRIPPSYIRNALNADSISKKENDSTLLLKAITVTTNNNRLTTTVTRTDSTLNFLVDIKRDTVTLASFGAGGGQAGDTTAFSTSTIYGSFYNDGTDTLVITSMRGILQGTSPSVTYDVYYNDSLNVTAGATKLVTAGTALTNTATGAAVTSFDNTKIPPGVWVWVKTTTVTTKPTYFSLSLVGYKSRKA